MPLSAPTTVTTASATSHWVVAARSPTTMPVSIARPTIHGPRVCGTIQTSATARPAQKRPPCWRTIHQRKARGERVSGSSAPGSVKALTSGGKSRITVEP